MPDDPHPEHPAGGPADNAGLPGRDDSLLAEARDALKTQIDSGAPGPMSSKLPKRIGRYRIISVLGQGGMGTVFEAEQEHPKRAVALKVVRAGRYVDEHYVRLFQREAQTLARLKHPGIATIYEAGCTDDGQHFFAMELVRGVVLNRYVEMKKLRLRARLRLFRRICDAINYAHQRGVIHRDLKPSNIIINEEGRPKILDFGLARITEADIAAATIVTEVGKIQGTLSYMSPEQARGNPDEIDVRSDVYTLGVLLYEMLTGRLPYDVEHTVLHVSVRTICENDPRKPSSLDGSLRGDTETILLKALAKEPGRRYQNAAALSEDIERFLTNQPILAHRPGTMYQLRKLVARHKAACSFVAVLFILISGFGVWMGILNSRLSTAERYASAKAETAENVKSFLIGLFGNADPNTRDPQVPTVRGLLDKGVEDIYKSLKNQPDVLAAMTSTLGVVYRNLGLYDQARPLLKEALEVRKGVYGQGDSPDLADSYFNYGWFLRFVGEYNGARKNLRLALEMRARLFGESNPAVAESLLVLGTIYRYQGAYDEAEELINKALQIQKRRLDEAAERGERVEIEKEVARCLETRAEVLEERGVNQDYETALHDAEEGLGIRKAVFGEHHNYYASTLEVLALILRDQGHYEEAERHTSTALSIYRASFKDEHHPFVINVLSSLGALLHDQGKLEEAEPFLAEAVQMCEETLRKDSQHVPYTATNLAWLYLDIGRYEDAERLFRKSRLFYEDSEAPDHPKKAEALRGLGQVELARGKPKQAEALLRKALAIYDKASKPNQWSRAITCSALLEILAGQRRFDEAEELTPESYDIMKKIRGEEDRYVRQARKRIYDLYTEWDKPQMAAEYSGETSGSEAVPQPAP